ncbi:MAG: hypothetical protein HS132_06170 [Planctomycetia bacterium]|nr:hypothetical protein [Planctomycetia bacterium]
MKKILATLAAGLFTLNASLATDARISGSWSGFYDRQTLAQTAENLRPGILDNWQHVILPALTAEERRRLEHVRFVIDIENPDSALNFFAISGEVHIPASSARMLGDLVASWMWLNQRGYSTDTVNEYLAILKYQWESGALRSGHYRPLEALGVPAGVRDDPAIADEYARVISNALFFFICHELGHVLYEHQGIVAKDAAAAAQSIVQEQQADTFALELMRRIGEMPISVPMFFMFAATLEPAPADPGYGRPHTHPQSSERIRSIATTLRTRSRGFARGFNDPSTAVAKVNAIADLLVNSVVTTLESPVIQDLWRQKGLKGRLEDLKPRPKTDLSSIGAAPGQNGGHLFDGTYHGKWMNLESTDFDVRMELQRNGETVVGSWTFGPNRVTVEGIVSDGRLYFDWKWGEDCFGKGELYPESDDRLSGTWGYNRKTSGGGIWSLARP